MNDDRKRPRKDASYAQPSYVPTRDDTKWIRTVSEFKQLEGRQWHFNHDQTEITLSLPEGYKFSIRFGEEEQEFRDADKA